MSLGEEETNQKTSNIAFVVRTCERWKDNKYVSAIDQALHPAVLNGIPDWDSDITPQKIAEYVLGAIDQKHISYWLDDRKELAWLEHGDDGNKRVREVEEEIKLEIKKLQTQNQ
jgi:hypothetical protein